MSNQKKRHDCKIVNGKYWALCSACRGRFHLPGCTAKKNKHKDCCEERHKMLHAQGHIEGLDDRGESMLPYL